MTRITGVAVVAFLLALLVACTDAAPAPEPSPPPSIATPSIARISAGGYHTCVIAPDGVASCWGMGDYGQLGTGSDETSAIPTRVVAPEGLRFTEIVAGNAHTCALDRKGLVRCWGIDGDGLHDAGLGEPHGVERLRFPPGVRMVSVAGYFHDCALTGDGDIWCWGRAGEGQRGNGSRADTAAPVEVRRPSGVLFTAIAVGGYHSCALAADGDAWCWGQDLHGQLGDGDGTVDRSVPRRVAAPAGTAFVTISAGFNHTCALTDAGAAWCWGEGTSGQLGDAGTVDAPRPVSVAMPEGVRFAAIDAGNAHTCAIATDATVWCWGLGVEGGAVDGSSAHVPVEVALDATAGATAISAGGFHTCALLDDGSIWCWGDDSVGQLGDGTAGGTSGPVRVLSAA